MKNVNKTMRTKELQEIYKSLCDKTYKKSAWNNGVNKYANELLETLTTNYKETNAQDLKKQLLNGADTWIEFSWGGSSLIYNEDIAERLCTQSELKRLRRKDGSLRNPNKKEDWLDTQARALFQAYRRIRETLVIWQTI